MTKPENDRGVYSIHIVGRDGTVLLDCPLNFYVPDPEPWARSFLAKLEEDGESLSGAKITITEMLPGEVMKQFTY